MELLMRVVLSRVAFNSKQFKIRMWCIWTYALAARLVPFSARNIKVHKCVQFKKAALKLGAAILS